MSDRYKIVHDDNPTKVQDLLNQAAKGGWSLIATHVIDKERAPYLCVIMEKPQKDGPDINARGF